MQIKTVEKKTRPYPRTPRERREYTAKPRLYVSHDGENVLENLVSRKSRPVDQYRGVMPEILKQLGLPADTKMRWSQKAGCPCGCSPGFVVPSYGRWDAWATVTGDRVSQDPAAQETVAARVASVLADPTLTPLIPAAPQPIDWGAAEDAKVVHDFGFPREILN